MKLDHEERPLRGARQPPAVEFGNVFRCEANVKRGPVLRYRDGIDFAHKAIVESLQINLRLVAERLAWLLDGLDQRQRFWPTAKTLGYTFARLDRRANANPTRGRAGSLSGRIPLRRFGLMPRSLDYQSGGFS